MESETYASLVGATYDTAMPYVLDHYKRQDQFDGEYVAVNSAPVIKDMVGWDIDRILNFCRARRWGTCVSNVDRPCDDSHRSQ